MTTCSNEEEERATVPLFEAALVLIQYIFIFFHWEKQTRGRSDLIQATTLNSHGQPGRLTWRTTKIGHCDQGVPAKAMKSGTSPFSPAGEEAGMLRYSFQNRSTISSLNDIVSSTYSLIRSLSQECVFISLIVMTPLIMSTFHIRAPGLNLCLSVLLTQLPANTPGKQQVVSQILGFLTAM